MWTLSLEINTRAGCEGCVKASWEIQGSCLLPIERQGPVRQGESQTQPWDLVSTEVQAACELPDTAEARSYTVFIHPNHPWPRVAPLP